MKFIKKILLLIILMLPLLLIGCDDNPQETIYYLTTEQYEITLTTGDTFQIEYETNIDGELSWDSLDEKVCTVDENGLVTALKKGTSTIYCYYNIYEFKVDVIVNPKPIKYYHLNIYGYDEIATTKHGVAIVYLLQQEYGTKQYPNFGNYIFEGYYEDKECTIEMDLYTKLTSDITIYPKLKLDTTKCDLMINISNTLFYEDEIKLNDEIIALTPDYSSSTSIINESLENYFLFTVEYDYNKRNNYVTNTYLDGDKKNINIPYNGYVIIVPKTNAKFNDLYNKIKVGTKISLDRYSINVATRLYINEQTEKQNVNKVNLSVTASYATLYDYNNDQYIFEKNANDKAYPASTTKIITALAALKYASLDLKITIGDELDVMYEGSDPGTAGSKKGQVWTLRQLLYAMLLPSGNDSAYSIAAGVAKSIPGNENKSTRELLSYFNELMNEVKDDVSAVNSHFMVPDGNSYYNADSSWSERITNHYVTANDMVKFAIMALNCPALAKVVSTSSIVFKLENGATYSFTNTNLLIRPSSDYYLQYVIGIKTGTTNPAGQCLIYAAEVDRRLVVGAVMKCTNRYADAYSILKTVFKD